MAGPQRQNGEECLSRRIIRVKEGARETGQEPAQDAVPEQSQTKNSLPSP